MDIIDQIKSVENDRELEALTFAAIQEACEYSSKANEPTKTLGSFLDINANLKLSTPDNSNIQLYLARTCYLGYIPKGTRIVYGTFLNTLNHGYSNNGFYYYADDESYVYDFFKYIREQKIEDDYNILVALSDFLADYFNQGIGSINRDSLHQLFMGPNGRFYPPVKEHSIKDFIGNGAALCTEYSLLAENILSALGFDIMYVMDNNHAYNIITHNNKAYILDYSQGIAVYDHAFNELDVHPFLREIPDATDETIRSFINEGMSIELNDYYLVDINGSLFQRDFVDKRKYGVAGYTLEDEIGLIRHK